jgi:pyruvate kinase
MQLPDHKTKIVCTIGPASDTTETLERLIHAGMNVARLNFSHGAFEDHAAVIGRIRLAAEATGRRVAIMADLPGPKIRIGDLAQEGIELEPGDEYVLTGDDVLGDRRRVSVAFPLADVLSPTDRVFINDGVIELEVVEITGRDVRCIVRSGGELRSRKGINLPAVELGISAFTERDRECLKFALDQGVDAISQSFVAKGADVEEVRRAAQALGHDPFIIAKIERAQALEYIDEILAVADGIMVARGDLGVEVPIEQMAVVQKRLMATAEAHSIPVITATEMLESMVYQRRPTRAEATDVANAILDGTDCVMLSAESAVGRFPVDATAMLAGIAAATEASRPGHRSGQSPILGAVDRPNPIDLVSLAIRATMEQVDPVAVVVPTHSGYTARHVARYRLPVWITAVSTNEATCQALQFSWGVWAEKVDGDLAVWSLAVRGWLHDHGYTGGLALLTQGPSEENPTSSHRMEILELG